MLERFLSSFRSNDKGSAEPPGLVLGDDGIVYLVKPDGTRQAVNSGGGGSGGSATVRGPFAFAFDTPGLDTGIEFYTPTPGDILLDLWFEVVEAWDGTTPRLDTGYAPFGGGAQLTGWFSYGYGDPADMTKQSFMSQGDSGIGPITLLNGATDMLGASMVGQAFDMLYVPAIPAGGHAEQRLVRKPMGIAIPSLPARFLDATPLSLCVSQTGATDGGSPGSTQGSALLYLLTATPVAL
jgi:hypothetical protein